MIEVLIADDFDVVRAGLRAVLDDRPDIAVVGEAEDGLQAVDAVERLKPDVLVVDLSMPGLHGIEVIRRVTARTDTRAIAFSMHGDESHIADALEAGAHGYVRKSDPTDDLIRAVLAVSEGRRSFPPDIEERMVNIRLASLSQSDDPYATLTSREREVVQLAAEGWTNREIGERLSISFRTVEVHRSNAMRKLGLQRTWELVRYAVRRGIISLD